MQCSLLLVTTSLYDQDDVEWCALSYLSYVHVMYCTWSVFLYS